MVEFLSLQLCGDAFLLQSVPGTQEHSTVRNEALAFEGLSLGTDFLEPSFVSHNFHIFPKHHNQLKKRALRTQVHRGHSAVSLQQGAIFLLRCYKKVKHIHFKLFIVKKLP